MSLPYLQYYLLFLVCKILPTNILYKISKTVAILFWSLNKEKKRVVIENLLPVFSYDYFKAYRVSKQVFINFSYYLVDLFSYRRIDENFIKDKVLIEGKEYLDALIERGERIVVVGAHIGNWELQGGIGSLLGYEVYAVVKEFNDKKIDNLFSKQRQYFRINSIPLGNSAKKCLELLKKNKIVALISDLDFTHRGIQVEMFGKKCYIARGAASLAWKVEGVVLPSFFVRDKNKYKLIIEKPIYLWENNRKKSKEELLREYSKVISEYIKKYPEQWFVFEKYWQ